MWRRKIGRRWMRLLKIEQGRIRWRGVGWEIRQIQDLRGSWRGRRVFDYYFIGRMLNAFGIFLGFESHILSTRYFFVYTFLWRSFTSVPPKHKSFCLCFLICIEQSWFLSVSRLEVLDMHQSRRNQIETNWEQPDPLILWIQWENCQVETYILTFSHGKKPLIYGPLGRTIEWISFSQEGEEKRRQFRITHNNIRVWHSFITKLYFFINSNWSASWLNLCYFICDDK